jgi:hypothetical protein
MGTYTRDEIIAASLEYQKRDAMLVDALHLKGKMSVQLRGSSIRRKNGNLEKAFGQAVNLIKTLIAYRDELIQED